MRTMALPVVCWVWPMHHTTVDGLFLAMVSAISFTWSSGTPLTSSTLSAVHFIASSRILSMP